MNQSKEEIFLKYFQILRKFSTGVILKIDGFHIVEVIMPTGPNIGVGISDDLSSLSFYEIDILSTSDSPKRFKKILATKIFVGKNFMINQIINFSN